MTCGAPWGLSTEPALLPFEIADGNGEFLIEVGKGEWRGELLRGRSASASAPFLVDVCETRRSAFVSGHACFRDAA